MTIDFKPWSLLAALLSCSGTAISGHGQTLLDGPTTHSLMPGVRSADLHDANWPRAMHDRLATGFSPLICNMSESPHVIAADMAVNHTCQPPLDHVEIRHASGNGSKNRQNNGATHGGRGVENHLSGGYKRAGRNPKETRRHGHTVLRQGHGERS